MSFFWSKKSVIEVVEEAVVESFTELDGDKVLSFFQKLTGMDFSHKKAIMYDKLKLFCRDKELTSFDELLSSLQTNSLMKRDLIDYLTINETYFNREFSQIEILPKLMNEQSKHIDILCLPCSSGEEVYSIIIKLLESSVRVQKFQVTGFDINTTILKQAREAHFSARSLHRMDASLLKKYFTKVDNHFELEDTVKKMAQFELHSIFELSSIQKYDYIYCRNLLIYFDEETTKKAISSLVGLLKDDGKIFFGHSDNVDESLNLKTSYHDGIKYYEKKVH